MVLTLNVTEDDTAGLVEEVLLLLLVLILRVAGTMVLLLGAGRLVDLFRAKKL